MVDVSVIVLARCIGAVQVLVFILLLERFSNCNFLSDGLKLSFNMFKYCLMVSIKANFTTLFAAMEPQTITSTMFYTQSTISFQIIKLS